MKKINILNENFFCFLFLFLPIFLVTGPAIPDIYLTFTAIFGLLYCLVKSDYLIFKNKLILLLFIFWFFLIISSLLSDNLFFSLSSSIPYVRYIFFIIFIYLFSMKKNYFFNDYLFKIMTICIIFVAFDTYLQFFLGNEIFGHKIDWPNQNRLTGPFPDDERIVGSYLSRFVFLVFGYLIYKSKNKFIYELFAFFILIFIYSCIFVTGERMAFLLTTFGILLLLLFNFKLFKKFALIFIFISLILGILTIKYDKVRLRMVNSTFEVLGYQLTDGMINKNEHNFFDSHYGAHYLTALEIFKDNKFFGSGARTFRIVCSNDKYASIDSYNAFQRCSTHPHNYYFQLLSETGFFGILSFLILILYFLKYAIKNLNLKNPLHNSALITLLLFLWPFQSTGNILNNWFGIYLFYFISVILILIHKEEFNKI